MSTTTPYLHGWELGASGIPAHAIDTVKDACWSRGEDRLAYCQGAIDGAIVRTTILTERDVS